MIVNRSRTSASTSGIVLLLATGALALAGCGSDDTKAAASTPTVVSANEATPLADDGGALAAVMGATEIPYPVYPNGRKYRVGGENGLKIVVFQTEDPFEKVDEYYQSISKDVGMPRLVAMSDYVRYSRDDDDGDPWATYKPGIVIHEFEDDGERRAVGARASAKTNIIMSF